MAELFGLSEKFANLIKFYTQESSLVPEIKAKVEKIYSKKEIGSEFSENAEILREKIAEFEQIPTEFSEFKANLMEKSGLKGKNFFMPLRLLLTGEAHGPELSELWGYIKDDIKEIVAL